MCRRVCVCVRVTHRAFCSCCVHDLYRTNREMSKEQQRNTKVMLMFTKHANGAAKTKAGGNMFFVPSPCQNLNFTIISSELSQHFFIITLSRAYMILRSMNVCYAVVSCRFCCEIVNLHCMALDGDDDYFQINLLSI